MNDFGQQLLAQSELVRPPFQGTEVEVCSHSLSPDFLSILRVSNGLISKRRIVRVFGTDSDSSIPSLFQWNDSEWKREYGRLAQGLVFVAEDIFGDQYGYMFRDGPPMFVKFYCEGGKTEEVAGGLNSLRRAIIDPGISGFFDLSLMEVAFSAGLLPSANEHLAFRVPLIVGGSHEPDNLCVEDIDIHLGTLAQISLRNTTLPDGSRINRFL